MTCDWCEDHGGYRGIIRCGEYTDMDDYIYKDIGSHKNYPLDLCDEHLKRVDEVDEEMIDMNMQVLEPYLGDKRIEC